MPTWRVTLYALLAGGGATWLAFHGIYEYGLSLIEPGGNGGQVGIGEFFLALYTAPVIGIAAGCAVAWAIRRLKPKRISAG
jgi:hypothetical protein